MKIPAVDAIGDAERMAPELALQVTALARACKAAARAVALYPAEHPAVAASIDALTSAAHAATAASPVRLAVLPDTLTVGGRRIVRPDAVVGELAALLHSHQVGQLTVSGPTDPDLWRRFLALLALPADHARLRGGLGKLWAAEGQPRIEVRSVDYRELLRDSLSVDRASWERIVATCLEGDATAVTIDDSTIDALFGILDDPSKIGDLVGAANWEAEPGAARGPLILAGLLRAVAKYIEHTHPERLDQALSALAEAAGRMPVATLVPIVHVGRTGTREELSRFVRELVRRISDRTIADMVAVEVRDGRGTSRQLADAFCGLAPEASRRSAILTLAAESLSQARAAGPAPHGLDLAQAWQQSETLLRSYADSAFVSDDYNVELQRLGDRAVDLDRDQTDPPDRLAAWRSSVSEERVRALDSELLVDLMGFQEGADKWRPLADLALSRVHVMVAMGDFGAAAVLVQALRSDAEQHPDPAVREAAAAVAGSILTPAMMRHVATYLDTSDRIAVDAVRRFCQALGTLIVGPLAEVLSREERTRSRQHLIAILIEFGAAGRKAVERLRQSPNAAVRRTAVLLLREFGGRDALAELESLLNDSEPHVQREATAAIATMRIEAAFETLVRALIRGTDRSVSTIMGVIWTLPDEEAQPLLAYLVARAPYRGALWAIHARAIPRLGAAGSRAAVDALESVLERRQVWAPFRMAVLHRLALAALARIDTPEAWRVIESAAVIGPLLSRSRARAHLWARADQRPGSVP